MVFQFRSKKNFGQHELEYLFFLSRKAQFFFPEFNIRLYDKNSESDYFLSKDSVYCKFRLHASTEVIVSCFVSDHFFGARMAAIFTVASFKVSWRRSCTYARKAQFFFPEFNIRLYDKNSESDYLFFPPPKSEYFFQQHWESEYLKCCPKKNF
jgi:hypothetical protein